MTNRTPRLDPDNDDVVESDVDNDSTKTDSLSVGSDIPVSSLTGPNLTVNSDGYLTISSTIEPVPLSGLENVSSGSLSSRPSPDGTNGWYFTQDSNGIYFDTGEWALVAENPGNIGQNDLGFDPATQDELDNHASDSSAHHTKTDPGTIQPGDLGFDPATQAELDNGLSGKANSSDIFSGSYTDLSDKPSLFSGSYSDLTDISIPEEDLSFDPATQAELNNHTAESSAHHTKTDPSSIGSGDLGFNPATQDELTGAVGNQRYFTFDSGGSTVYVKILNVKNKTHGTNGAGSFRAVMNFAEGRGSQPTRTVDMTVNAKGSTCDIEHAIYGEDKSDQDLDFIIVEDSAPTATDYQYYLYVRADAWPATGVTVTPGSWFGEYDYQPGLTESDVTGSGNIIYDTAEDSPNRRAEFGSIISNNNTVLTDVDNSISLSHLSFDPATQSELDNHTSESSAHHTKTDPSSIGPNDLGFDPATQDELNDGLSGKADENTQAYSTAESGSEPLNGNESITIDTGISTGDTWYLPEVIPPADCDYAVSIHRDDSGSGNWLIHFEQNNTSVTSGTVQWRLKEDLQ